MEILIEPPMPMPPTPLLPPGGVAMPQMPHFQQQLVTTLVQQQQLQQIAHGTTTPAVPAAATRTTGQVLGGQFQVLNTGSTDERVRIFDESQGLLTIESSSDNHGALLGAKPAARALGKTTAFECSVILDPDVEHDDFHKAPALLVGWATQAFLDGLSRGVVDVNDSSQPVVARWLLSRTVEALPLSYVQGLPNASRQGGCVWQVGMKEFNLLPVCQEVSFPSRVASRVPHSLTA